MKRRINLLIILIILLILTEVKVLEEIERERVATQFSFKAPSFITTVKASGGKTFLEEEAGICAYTNIGREIDLAIVKSLYRTIEYETEEYIIGSIPIPGYGKSEDAHLYINRDGWIIIYYLKDDPVAKIVDWLSYQGSQISTKLEKGLSELCNNLGIPLVDVNYYDFRAPDANQLMIIVGSQKGEGVDSFKIKIPSEFIVYGKSWSHYAYNAYYSRLKIDGEQINGLSCSYKGWNEAYGMMTPTQLKPDVYHTITLQQDYRTTYSWYGTAFAAIAIVYRGD